MRLSAMALGFVCLCAVVIGIAAPAMQDEDVRGAFLTSRPKEKTTTASTSKPWPDSGVTSNKVMGGADFSFPSGSENSITLDKTPGTDNFTVIFSKSPLSSPSFLDMQVTFEPLTASQQADFKAFVSKYQGQRPLIELDESNAGAPFVRVKAKPDPSGNPMVFDIRIQHN